MSNLPVVLEAASFAELKRLVFQQKRELISLRRSLQHVAVRRHQAVWPPGAELYRGVTDAALTKGSSATVSRYTPGTTTDSGENDTVYNDFADVGSGKKIAYMRNGDKLYLIAAECPLT